MNKPKSVFVKEMFNSIASQYDFLNYVISFGQHKFIKIKAVEQVKLSENADILDLCAGTGDISMILAKKYPFSGIKAVDYSENMLNIAKKRIKNNNIEFIQADALNLPFEDNSFDAVFISFGLRNLESIEKGLIEIKRVLKNNGILSILDVGKPNVILMPFFNCYFSRIMPLIAGFFIKNKQYSPYNYLSDSAADYPSQHKMVKILKELGYSEIKNYNYIFESMAQQVAKVEK
ncbi:MAG: bifunctional demethylmenaquinone methyltransferase/2-methoxy-6-polyprenyl-1,4-benzoquinol methylase UbiE [bacterium]